MYVAWLSHRVTPGERFIITIAKQLALIGGMMFLITGCSGGGGTKRQSSPATPQPPPTMPEPPPVTPEPDESEAELRQEYAAHPEFRNQPALEQVNAHYAYARGATGEGVTIGIIDSGIDPGHTKFEGKLHPDSYNVAGYNPDYSFCCYARAGRLLLVRRRTAIPWYPGGGRHGCEPANRRHQWNRK